MAEEELVETFYDNAGDWVMQYFLPIYNRYANNSDTFWCPQWWKHPEALNRLTFIWMTWEQARRDPPTLSTWWREHADYHMSILMSDRGPMRYCKNGKHEEERYAREALKIEPYPADLFA